MAHARSVVNIQHGDDLQCEFNRQWMPCKALSSFSSNDVRRDEERLVKIKICESAHSKRYGLANIECLIPLPRQHRMLRETETSTNHLRFVRVLLQRQTFHFLLECFHLRCHR